MLVLANLGREPRIVDVARDVDGQPGSVDVFANRRYDGSPDLTKLELDGLAYRWLRLH